MSSLNAAINDSEEGAPEDEREQEYFGSYVKYSDPVFKERCHNMQAKLEDTKEKERVRRGKERERAKKRAGKKLGSSPS